VIVASSLLAVMYIWRLVETLYMKQPVAGAHSQQTPLSMLVPVWITALATIYFGLDTDLTLSVARIAADGLLSGFGAGGQ